MLCIPWILIVLSSFFNFASIRICCHSITQTNASSYSLTYNLHSLLVPVPAPLMGCTSGAAVATATSATSIAPLLLLLSSLCPPHRLRLNLGQLKGRNFRRGYKTHLSFGVIIKCWPPKVYTFPIKTSPPKLLLFPHSPRRHQHNRQRRRLPSVITIWWAPLCSQCSEWVGIVSTPSFTCDCACWQFCLFRFKLQNCSAAWSMQIKLKCTAMTTTRINSHRLSTLISILRSK